MADDERSEEHRESASTERVIGPASRTSISLSQAVLAPLDVESAEFELELAVEEIRRHGQMRASVSEHDSEEQERPWFLVDRPISLHGVVAPAQGPEERAREASRSTVRVSVKVGTVPQPEGLGRLLSTLTQLSDVAEVGDENET